jgi:hypothetical protein
VRQLAQAVERLSGRKPEGILGVDLSGIKTLLPLVVMRDDFGSAFGMNTYLHYRFRELNPGPNSSFEIPSLFSLSVDDIEKLTPYLSDSSLAEILLAKFRQEPSLFSPFWIVRNDVLEKKDLRKPQWVYDSLKELTRVSADRLGFERRDI